MAQEPPLIHLLNRLLGQLSQQREGPRNEKYIPPLNIAQVPSERQRELKPFLLTLHCLFPNELLPALDIVDRGLVKRLAADGLAGFTGQCNGAIQISDHVVHDTQGTMDDVFFVTSSSSPPGSNNNNSKCYEVRLHAWNCTCPTFSLLQFRPLVNKTESEFEESDPFCHGFGGTLTRIKSSAVCKHLLACLLLERCPGLFGECGRIVDREELGGHCAGWHR